MPEGKEVQAMFGSIAPRYDRANHWLSLGIDYYWRYRLMQAVKRLNPKVVVDLATGSGDVAFCLRKHLPAGTTITGLDFCEPMLAEARAKQVQLPDSQKVSFAFGDCLALPIASQSVDALTISFGLRNLQDRAAGLQEMHRVLKPGSGRLYILEFSQPYPWLSPLYKTYLHTLLPKLAGWITGKANAYEYLGSSIDQFPNHTTLTKEILQAGFEHVQVHRLTGGIVAIHEAWA
ncbi:MAG: bifunctional demethylmenaquinone methyltransferase/2-methoxy-6-polyprenyl-1,4-benzoquinol methylase [Verrucomicrobia bacterium 21-51-4]|nr:MAG: bifunctional demethylmenaquinone methyltransferase/2-methoxy-6-polyprenyl-1,4-benzoquinol methylase [Verrucomicrobia bacterium 21-51-4]HQU08789.1 bifunctional demethylmenaquinone methyltransferase/2-methoxy-6-polyprenyl-1,4-benzoquinol methylase UbiE [Opitutales bacterium]